MQLFVLNAMSLQPSKNSNFTECFQHTFSDSEFSKATKLKLRRRWVNMKNMWRTSNLLVIPYLHTNVFEITIEPNAEDAVNKAEAKLPLLLLWIVIVVIFGKFIIYSSVFGGGNCHVVIRIHSTHLCFPAVTYVIPAASDSHVKLSAV